MDLSSAQRKFFRGLDHVRCLLAEVDAFEESNAYVFESEVASRTDEGTEYRCYGREVTPVPDHWPLVAGDALQNLRASLDHVIFEATGGQEYSKFPIYVTSGDFEAEGRKHLEELTPEMQKQVEAAQPFNRTPDAPRIDALSILNRLAVLDKHKVLATVAAAVLHEGVGTAEGVDIKWKKPATGQGLRAGKTHISTFIALSETKDDELNLEPIFKYHVHIERMPIENLRWVSRQTFRAMNEAESGCPLDPWQRYPI